MERLKNPSSHKTIKFSFKLTKKLKISHQKYDGIELQD